MDGNVYSYYLSFVAAGVVFTTGLMSQLFIVAVNILKRLEGKPLSTTDGIITCLGGLRAMYLLVCLSFMIRVHLFKMDPVTRYILYFLHMNLSSANIWLSTFLTVVFCLKISSFPCDSFLHLKMFISRRYLHVIFVFALISISYHSIDFWIRHIKIPENSTILLEHLKLEGGNQKQLKIVHVCLILSWNFALIVLHCFSSFALIISLCLHVKKMKKVANCLAAHYRALKLTVFSLVGCTVHINIVLFKQRLFNSLGFTWTIIIINIFPTLHTIYLICTLSKSRQYFLSIPKGGFMNLFNRREEQHTTMVETISL
ncbi:taste receptor type 2 member 50-like [Mantella aurantiaca]